MKRILPVFTVLMIMLTLGVHSAVGLATGKPSQAIYIDKSNTDHNSEGVLAVAGGLGCSVNELTFMRWDLTDLGSKTIATAKLFMTVLQSVGTGTLQVTLYKVADNTWTASPPPTYPGPVLGDALQTLAVDATATDYQLVFDAVALKSYIDAERLAGRTSVNFGLQIASCGTGGVGATIYFYDNSGTCCSPNPEDPGTAPFLQLLDSNAVTLRFFRSADPAVNWPLLAGGAALAALLAGAGVYRWRLRRAEAR